MRWRIYIETTIPSFYYNDREEAENIARCRWTRMLWDNHRQDFDWYTSPIVISELSEGSHSYKSEKLNLLKEVSILDHRPEIEEAGSFYIRHFLMPARTYADALHMAFASVYRCDILLTWNCAHLANLNKRSHLAVINSRLGLPVPWVVTPLEVLGNYANE